MGRRKGGIGGNLGRGTDELMGRRKGGIGGNLGGETDNGEEQRN